MNLFDAIPKLENENESDFIGSDGLKYCGKCHTPKQVRIKILDREFVNSCICKCEAEKYNAEREAIKQAEKRAEIEKNKSFCFPEKQCFEWRFENDNGENRDFTFRIKNILKKYAENFPKMLSENRGILLYGNVGSGKSFAAACVANAVLDMGYTVHMTNFSRIINTLWGYSGSRQEYIDRIVSYDLLVIDDLSVERDTPYAKEIITSTIDARDRSGKPLIITTNLSDSELFGNSPELSKHRVYSRIAEMCIPVKYVGDDRRIKKMRESLAKYKEILGL